MAATKRKYTPEQKQEMISYAKLYGSVVAGQHFGVPDSTIRDWIWPRRTNHSDRPQGRGAIHSPMQREEALKRIATDGVKKTSRDMEIATSTLHEWMRIAGVTSPFSLQRPMPQDKPKATVLERTEPTPKRKVAAPILMADQTPDCPPHLFDIQRVELWTCKKCGHERIVYPPDPFRAFQPGQTFNTPRR